MKGLFYFAWFVSLQVCLLPSARSQSTATTTRDSVQLRVQQQAGELLELYRQLHAHPELSFMEEKTSARVAEELRKAGYEVTTGVGRFGVVGVLRNGTGPTILIRTDLDGLPVKEQTGLPYASTVVAKDSAGYDVPVMHACGHDMNMTCIVGAARVLAQLKERWQGTLVVIGQPAEERGGGARAMLADGLFTRFPQPDFCMAIHDDAELPAGSIGYTPGYAAANVDSVDITIHGVGGHGAYPHKTKDPIVLAAKIVLDLQTIVSREIQPGEPAVVTVGSIHGGSKHNIIPDEVQLQLTVRSYTDEVRQQTLAAIKRIVRGQAIAAGVPEDRLPEVKLQDEFTPAAYNNPELAEKMAGVFRAWFGEPNVIRKKSTMGGEDFGEYGRTEHKIPIFMFLVGGVRPEALKEHEQTGKPLPTLHSSLWAPLPEPTMKTGVTAMSAAVLELMGKKATE
jgi:amidohydrolase